MIAELGLTAPTATLVVGAISAFIALMVAVMTKEAKVSEFRQLWINAIRDDIAEAISAASTLSVVMNLSGETDKERMFVEWGRFAAAIARIDLRLNVSEGPHKELEKCLRNAEKLVSRLQMSGAYEQEEWIALQDEVIGVSKPLLKIEWDRVRKGEPTYRFTQGVLIVVAVVLPLIVLATYVCSDVPAQEFASSKTSHTQNGLMSDATQNQQPGIKRQKIETP